MWRAPGAAGFHKEDGGRSDVSGRAPRGRKAAERGSAPGVKRGGRAARRPGHRHWTARPHPCCVKALRVHVTIARVRDVFMCVLRRGGDVICDENKRHKISRRLREKHRRWHMSAAAPRAQCVHATPPSRRLARLLTLLPRLSPPTPLKQARPPADGAHPARPRRTALKRRGQPAGSALRHLRRRPFQPSSVRASLPCCTASLPPTPRALYDTRRASPQRIAAGLPGRAA